MMMRLVDDVKKLDQEANPEPAATQAGPGFKENFQGLCQRQRPELPSPSYRHLREPSWADQRDCRKLVGGGAHAMLGYKMSLPLHFLSPFSGCQNGPLNTISLYAFMSSLSVDFSDVGNFSNRGPSSVSFHHFCL